MDVKYDMMADAVYLTVGANKIARTLELQDRINVDLDDKDRIVGIEILEASHQEALVESLKKSVTAGIPVGIVNTVPQLA